MDTLHARLLAAAIRFAERGDDGAIDYLLAVDDVFAREVDLRRRLDTLPRYLLDDGDVVIKRKHLDRLLETC